MIGFPPHTIEPLEIRLRIAGAIKNPPKIDGLLAAMIAQYEGLLPPTEIKDCVPIEIPLAREPGGRFHLCSWPVFRVEAHEERYKQRRPVVPEIQMFGSPKIKSVNIATGLSKGFRLPYQVTHLERDEIVWWAMGDKKLVERFLSYATHLGSNRGVGHGRVINVSVTVCETWDGFPLTRDRQPLRALPADWPGVDESDVAYCPLTYPYWGTAPTELCCVPY